MQSVLFCEKKEASHRITPTASHAHHRSALPNPERIKQGLLGRTIAYLEVVLDVALAALVILEHEGERCAAVQLGALERARLAVAHAELDALGRALHPPPMPLHQPALLIVVLALQLLAHTVHHRALGDERLRFAIASTSITPHPTNAFIHGANIRCKAAYRVVRYEPQATGTVNKGLGKDAFYLGGAGRTVAEKSTTIVTPRCTGRSVWLYPRHTSATSPMGSPRPFRCNQTNHTSPVSLSIEDGAVPNLASANLLRVGALSTRSPPR